MPAAGKHEREAPLVGGVAHERGRGRAGRRAAVEQRVEPDELARLLGQRRRRRRRSSPRRPRRCTSRRTRWRWPGATGAPPPRPTAAAATAKATAAPAEHRAGAEPLHQRAGERAGRHRPDERHREEGPEGAVAEPEGVLHVRRGHRPGHRRTARATRTRSPPGRRDGSCARSRVGGIAHHYPRTRCSQRPRSIHARPSRARPRRSTPPTPTCGRSRRRSLASTPVPTGAAPCATRTITAETLAVDPLTRTCTQHEPGPVDATG